MPGLSSADHSVSPPKVTIPREFNAAYDLIERNLRAGRALILYLLPEGKIEWTQQ